MRSVFLAAVLVAAASQAQAATVNHVMDFSTGDVCGNFPNDTPRYTCTANGQTIALAYGDQSGVDVEWHRDTDEGVEGRFNIRGVGTNEFATIPSNLHQGSIILRALDGATVGLQGFEFVGREHFGSFESSFTINDLAGGFSSIFQAVPESDPSERRAFDFSNLTSTVGIEILLGPDASFYGWGIDDIRYSVTDAGSTSAIPLPAGGLLLIGALGGLAALRRRRAA